MVMNNCGQDGKRKDFFIMDNTQLIISMYKNNISIKKISNILEIPEHQVYEYLCSQGYSRFKDRNKERDESICKLYQEDKPIKEIAEILNIDRHTVTKIVKTYNLYKGDRHANNLSEEKSERNKKILQLYEEGKSCRQVGKIIGVCPSTVSNVLAAFHKQPRSKHQQGHSKGTTKNRKHIFDLNFFETIDTEEKAYWLGFLYADGCVRYKGTITLALQEQDKEHIENFLKAIRNYDIIPSYERKTKSYRATVCSVKMAEDLRIHGCLQKKSLRLSFPSEKDVPKKLIHHFMRGYFDGDGCFTNIESSNPQFSILGTPRFLDGYENVLLSHLNNQKRTKRVHRKNWNEQTEEIIYSGYKRISDIYHYLYHDATIYLKRKKDKFEKWTSLGKSH